ncbi:MAG: hypothetical protein U5L98_08175 [Halomonas sp.]|uniref:hypothetical protein n=1 Tax=Halomonas sp. TaxID=1486246 RepID=UPI002ACE06E7|nr:hypothetical protein [Halomonas sp.]MDZ7852605.1 hypothetical protein [Halomonas sp.]
MAGKLAAAAVPRLLVGDIAEEMRFRERLVEVLREQLGAARDASRVPDGASPAPAPPAGP